jgi:hypothetical protein
MLCFIEEVTRKGLSILVHCRFKEKESRFDHCASFGGKNLRRMLEREVFRSLYRLAVVLPVSGVQRR